MRAWELKGGLINTQIYIGRTAANAYKFCRPEKETPWTSGGVSLCLKNESGEDYAQVKEINFPAFKSKLENPQSRFLEECSVIELVNYVGGNKFSQVLCETFRQMALEKETKL